MRIEKYFEEREEKLILDMYKEKDKWWIYWIKLLMLLLFRYLIKNIFVAMKIIDFEIISDVDKKSL